MIDSPRCETCGKEVGKDRDAYCAGHGLPAEHAPPLTTAELAAALDDVLETTTWEGKGASLAPVLLAALKSRRPALAGSGDEGDRLTKWFLDVTDAQLYAVWRAGMESPHDTEFSITQAMRGELLKTFPGRAAQEGQKR